MQRVVRYRKFPSYLRFVVDNTLARETIGLGNIPTTFSFLQIVIEPRYHLVGGWADPLKNMNVNWDDEIPNIWEN